MSSIFHRIALGSTFVAALSACEQSDDAAGTTQGAIVCDGGHCSDAHSADATLPGADAAPDLLPEPSEEPEDACDGLDDDGDGEIDEYIYGCESSTLPPAGAGSGDESDDELPGADEAPDLLPEPSEEPEDACDGLDDDGDGEIDEYIYGCESSTLPPAGAGSGDESDDELPGADEAPDLLPEPSEEPEDACDGLDDDGDGEIDEYIYGCETSTLP